MPSTLHHDSSPEYRDLPDVHQDLTSHYYYRHPITHTGDRLEKGPAAYSVQPLLSFLTLKGQRQLV